MSSQVGFLVDVNSPDDTWKPSHKYLIAGYFNIGGNESWCDGFNDRREMVWTFRRLYRNETVCHPWVILEAATGHLLWDSEDGFNPDFEHPAWMEKAIP